MLDLIMKPVQEVRNIITAGEVRAEMTWRR